MSKNRLPPATEFLFILQICRSQQITICGGNLVAISCLAIGQPTAVDVDGDGFTELFVPSYSVDLLYVFSYSPAE